MMPRMLPPLRFAKRLFRKLFRRRARWLTLAALLLTGLFAASFPLLNCHCTPIFPTNTNQPITPIQGQGVPLIRVKLTKLADGPIGTSGAYSLYCDGKLVAQSSSAMPPVSVARTGRAWIVGGQSFSGDSLELQVPASGLTQYGPTSYRGSLRLAPTEGSQFAVVNCLDIENYLAGVISKELRSNWSDETYKALAVAARTFARYQAITFGRGSFYDVTDDQASQVYGGYSAETTKSRSAVSQTYGQMLVCNTGSGEGLFLTQYSAACGGTVNGAYVLRNVQQLPPTVGGQHCDDCSTCPKYAWPPVRISKADVYKAVVAAYPNGASLGLVSDVRVASMTPYGRAWWVDVYGRPGMDPLRLRADDLRLSLLRSRNASGASIASSLYSMNCQIRSVGDSIEFYDGKGFGHGVGLCQWGAEGKALKGWNSVQILNFYYPGARIVKAY